jgi:hypothetical protein
MNRARICGLIISHLALTALVAPQSLVAATILRIDEVVQTGWKNQLRAGRALKPQAADAQETLSISLGSRRYTIDLVSNIRLLERMPAEQRAEVLDPTVELWRGSIRGMSGSWARLLRTPRGLYGAMFDGAQLFRITALGDIREQLLNPSELPDSRIVAFSMDDVVVTPGAMSCEVHPASRTTTAATSYAKLDRELRTLQGAHKPGATRQLDVSILVDNSASIASPGMREMALDSAGIADGIYSEQLGLELRVTSFAIVPASEPLMSGSDVLGGARTYRAGTPALQSTGVTYVFTGRSLGDDVVGKALLDGACGPADGVAAGVVNNSGLMGIVMAHEIAHSLGAIHDGEATCASAPSGFLMAPEVTGSRQFSQCSLDALQPQVAGRICIANRQPAQSELEIRLVAPMNKVLLNLTTRIEFEIRNRGYENSQNAHLLIDLPAALEAHSSSSCETSSATQIDCLLGQVQPIDGGGRLMFAVVTPRETGQFTFGARIESDNEGPGPFDSLSHDFEVVRGIIVEASLHPIGGTYLRVDPQSARMEEGEEVRMEAAAVNGFGRLPAHAKVTLTMPADWPVSNVEATKGSCNLIRDARGTVLDCDVGVLPPSDLTSDIAFVRFTTKPLPGTHQVRTSVTDADGGENIAGQSAVTFNLTVNAAVTPPPPPPPPPPQNGGSGQSGGGGGGSFSSLTLLLMLLRWWPRLRE